jgi:hypothetical protein
MISLQHIQNGLQLLSIASRRTHLAIHHEQQLQQQQQEQLQLWLNVLVQTFAS